MSNTHESNSTSIKRSDLAATLIGPLSGTWYCRPSGLQQPTASGGQPLVCGPLALDLLVHVRMRTSHAHAYACDGATLLSLTRATLRLRELENAPPMTRWHPRGFNACSREVRQLANELGATASSRLRFSPAITPAAARAAMMNGEDWLEKIDADFPHLRAVE